MGKFVQGLFGGGKTKSPEQIKADQDQANREYENNAINLSARTNNGTDQFGNTLSTTVGPDGKLTYTKSLGSQGQQYINGMSALGQQAQTGLSTLMGRTMDTSAVGNEADKIYASMSGNMNRNLEAKRQALDVKLRNQGLVPGTEAYDRAARGYENSADDAVSSLYGQSYGQAQAAALANLSNAQNFALGVNNQVNPIMARTLGYDATGQQNITPAQPTNMVGIDDAYNKAEAAKGNALWGALGGIGGAVLGMPGVGAGIGNGLARMGRGVADAWTAANS